ncbi:MAG: glycosyltransferase family 39 protein [Flavobacteriales bacterium]
MNDYPSHTHAWAQSDRFAISKGFVNNDLNFFEPETYLLNPQFPDFWETPQEKSITSVDFPIHDYLPAVFMKITGVDSPWVVRLYNLLYSFLGLFFLYKLALFYLKNELKALFILGFASTSPVFIFYQNSFLPTIPSLANAIIGIYFYAKFSGDNRNKNFNLAIIFLTLGALSRTTFLIPLIAILGVEFIQIIRKKSVLKPKLLPVFLSLFLFVGYYFYNKYLRNLYGSSFLDSLMNADSFEAFFSKLMQSIDTWKMDYFSSVHYFIYLILIASAILLSLLLKRKVNPELKKFSFFLGILFLGNFLFLIAMVHQFMVHDYYFLDSFYLPSILLLIPLLSFLPTFETSTTVGKISVIAMALVIGFFITKQGAKSQQKRYTYNFWEDDKVVENYKIADKALTDLGFGKEEKILVFESFAPNLPLLVLDRKGFAIMANRTSTIDKALTWDYDAIVIRNEAFVAKILPVYPDILNKMTKIWGNDNIMICKKGNSKSSFNSFFDVEEKELKIRSSTHILDSTANQWLNLDYTLKDSVFSLKMGKGDGPVFAKHTRNFFNTRKTVFFEGNFKFPEENKANITICVTDQSGKNLYYQVKDVKNLIPSNKEWNTVKLWLNIPGIDEENLEFKLYINNSSQSSVYMDSLSVKIFDTEG